MLKVIRLFSLLIFFVTVSSFSFSLYANNRAGAITLSLAYGYDYFSDKREMQNTGLPLVILGYNFSKQWGVEALFSMFTTHFQSSVHDDRDIDGTILAFDAVYRFLSYRFMEPYVLAGLGAIGLNPNRNDAHNEGNINAGIGTQLFISKSIAFRLEARDFYTIVGGKNDIILDAGMTFLFDLC